MTSPREASTGSSPLARGLLPRIPCFGYPKRIIPARAGFTGRGRRGSWSGCGSSPLARGLREAVSELVGGGGIIPARAGFTGEVGVRAVHFRDHPRSRGVYISRYVDSLLSKGSSPLARGLPRPRTATIRPCRIIPARAGFTFASALLRATSQDHPRSRGVYTNSFPHGSISHGSSPLARGLPWEMPWKVLAGRIIPARAGFT